MSISYCKSTRKGKETTLIFTPGEARAFANELLYMAEESVEHESIFIGSLETNLLDFVDHNPHETFQIRVNPHKPKEPHFPPQPPPNVDVHEYVSESSFIVKVFNKLTGK